MPSRVEEQPEFDVAEDVSLAAGDRAVHQRCVEPLVSLAQLPDLRDQLLLN
jgi:hypothetical protein